MISTQECLQHIRDTLGGELSADLTAISILNQAGQHLATMHEWLFYQRPIVSLDIRGDVVFTNGSSPNNSSVLTVSGASSYVFLEGDQVQLTSGTGVTAQFCNIVSQAGTALTLDITIQSSGGAVSNIAGTIITRACRLPSDFRKVLSIVPTEGLVSSFTFTNMASIAAMRANGINVSGLVYWGAITYGRNRATTGGQPVPRLEIYPTTQTSVSNALKLNYVAGWQTLTSDSVVVEIPDFVDNLYIQLVRSFARAYAQEDTAQLDVRLSVIHKGPLYKAAIDRDGEVQGNMGQMLGGAAQDRGYAPRPYYIDTSVGGPS